jgi:hypothetical protein
MFAVDDVHDGRRKMVHEMHMLMISKMNRELDKLSERNMHCAASIVGYVVDGERLGMLVVMEWQPWFQ